MKQYFLQTVVNILDPEFRSYRTQERDKALGERLDEITKQNHERVAKLEAETEIIKQKSKATKELVQKMEVDYRIIEQSRNHLQKPANNYNCKIELKAVKEVLENGSECTPMLEKLKQCIEMSANMQKQIASHK